MTKPKPTTWNDRTFRSINAAARYCNVDSDTMHQWLKRGYTCDDDIEDRRKNAGKFRVVYWNSKCYPSLTEAAKAQGITKGAMRERLERGYTQDSDMERPRK